MLRQWLGDQVAAAGLRKAGCAGILLMFFSATCSTKVGDVSENAQKRLENTSCFPSAKVCAFTLCCWNDRTPFWSPAFQISREHFTLWEPELKVCWRASQGSVVSRLPARGTREHPWRCDANNPAHCPVFAPPPNGFLIMLGVPKEYEVTSE